MARLSSSGGGIALQDLLCNALAAIIVLTMIATAFAGLGRQSFEKDRRRARQTAAAASSSAHWELLLHEPGRAVPRVAWVHAAFQGRTAPEPMRMRVVAVSGSVPEHSVYKGRTGDGSLQYIAQLDLGDAGDWDLVLEDIPEGQHRAPLLLEVMTDGRPIFRCHADVRGQTDLTNGRAVVRLRWNGTHRLSISAVGCEAA